MASNWVARVAFALIMLGTLAAVVPSPTQAAPSEGLLVTDATGDVVALRPEAPGGVPASTGLDLTEVKLFAENGETFSFQAKLVDLKGESNYAVATGGVTVNACFTWNGHLASIRVGYTLPNLQVSESKIGPVDTCDPTVAPRFAGFKAVASVIDPVTNTIIASVSRTQLADIMKTTPPVAGDTFQAFRAYAADRQRERFDLAPNTGTASGAFTFTTNTANLDLKARVDRNAGSLKCAGKPGLLAYAIEAGGKRGVPILLMNTQGAPRTVQLQVETVDGLDWKPVMLPKIDVPAGAGSGAGNVTVNVIVDTPASAKHKDCATLRVTATDASAPGVLGQTNFNVIAVNPPGPLNKKLFFHASAQATCVRQSQDYIWMNTLESDPDDAKVDVLLNGCRDPSALSTTGATVRASVDVNPSHDLVLNTSASGGTAILDIALRSDGAPTTAHVVATLVTGQDVLDALGEADATVAVSSTATRVHIEIPVTFTRDQVATGDPSRVVSAEDGLGVLVQYDPAPADSLIPVAPAGRVFLLPTQSTLQLPIWSTIKRNVNDPGVGGSLLSITPDGKLPEFASPGAMRLFNFTVLNEGAQPDVAVVSAALAGPAGWTAEIFPSAPIALQPGESARVQIGVKPRPEASESEPAILDVTVKSQKDPTALASVSARVVATREGGVPFEDAPKAIAGQSKHGLVPGFEVPLALVALVGLVLIRRRS